MKESQLRKLMEDAGLDVIAKNHRNWLVLACPFAEFTHESGSDEHPSFFVHVNGTGLSGFHCFTCGQKGNLSRLFRRLFYYTEDPVHRRASMEAATKDIPENFGDYDDVAFNDPDPIPIDKGEEALYMDMYRPAHTSKDAMHYLRTRGIGPKEAAFLDLRYDPVERRIMFPVRGFDGELYGFTGRATRPNDQPRIKDYFGLPKDRTLLGADKDNGKPFLIVEGLFAYAHVTAVGARQWFQPIATMKCSVSPYQAATIIDRDRPVYMLYDNDRPGIKGTERAYDLLHREVPFRICRYPRDIDDPDFLTHGHLEKMFHTFHRSTPLT